MDYQEFLQSKIIKHQEVGFEVDRLPDFLKAIGCELKDSYFEVAVKNCKKAVDQKLQIELFT